MINTNALLRAAVLLFSILVASCAGKEDSYVREAVRLMDKHAIYAEGEEWIIARSEALKAKPQSMEEAKAIVNKTLKVAGGKHSFIVENDLTNSAKASSDCSLPEIIIDDNHIAIIKIPSFQGSREEGIKYAGAINEAIPDDIVAAVIDLRRNNGGNMYPMISAINRFIDAGDWIIRFKGRKINSIITLDYAVTNAGCTPGKHISCPVAILTDGMTGSSGEVVLLCFRGMENARTFGAPTAGYASCNVPYTMSDGSSLVLTTGCDIARTGEIFCDDPIAPDILTDSPLEDAIEWLKSQI